jgi:hypothetical protein
LKGILAILKRQAEFADNMVKCMEITKRSQDVRDEELARMLSGLGGVKDSQANYSKAEQLRIEHKPEVVSRVLSGGNGCRLISLYLSNITFFEIYGRTVSTDMTISEAEIYFSKCA